MQVASGTTIEVELVWAGRPVLLLLATDVVLRFMTCRSRARRGARTRTRTTWSRLTLMTSCKVKVGSVKARAKPDHRGPASEKTMQQEVQEVSLAKPSAAEAAGTIIVHKYRAARLAAEARADVLKRDPIYDSCPHVILSACEAAKMCDVRLSAAYASLRHVAHRDYCQRFPVPAQLRQRSLCKGTSKFA